MSRFVSTLRAAFVAPANLLGLAASGVASAITSDPTPAIVAASVEVFYLALYSALPRTRRAAQAVRREKEAARELRRLVEELAPSQREHYEELRALRDKILTNYRRLPGGSVLIASSERQVDALLTAFLRLLSTLNGYRRYLNASDKKAVADELEALNSELAGENNARIREVKEKRVEILKRRMQRFAQAEESREVVSHQLAGIEDLLRLTHEQSIAIRDPESISRQLSALSAEVQATEETVRELEQFLHVVDEVAPHVPHGVRVR